MEQQRNQDTSQGQTSPHGTSGNEAESGPVENGYSGPPPEDPPSAETQPTSPPPPPRSKGAVRDE